MKKALLFISLFSLSLPAAAQSGPMPGDISDSSVFYQAPNEPWTLQQCIDFALKNNITVKQQELNVDQNKINLMQSKGNVLPNINGTASHMYQYGRTVDRFTNTFANDRVLSQNFFVSSSMTLFNGLQNYNTIRQNQFALEAGKATVEQTKNDIALQVSSAYLNVLYATEQFDVADRQVKLTQSQVDRMQKLVDAGAQPKGALLDLQSQLAQEELALVNARNTLNMAYLSLTQIMNLQKTDGFVIVKPVLDTPAENILSMTPDQIYQIAIGTQPMIKSAQFSYQSAEKAVDASYGAYSPNITLQGSLGTGYSGLAKKLESTSVSGADTIGFTSGGDYVLIPSFNNTYSIIPFSEQMDNNLNRSIGVSVTVPIFNRFQVHSNVERAKIQRESAELNLELAKQQLYKNIQQAHADALAAFQKFQAAEKSLKAAREAFKYTEDKFNVGAVNAFDYNNSKTRVSKAEADLVQAKFEYIFRLKVLDYYMGKPITF
ncbi:MAG: TolC family protein [Bacteroidia bacterium]